MADDRNGWTQEQIERMRWRTELPTTPAEAIELLEHRIDVHARWRDFVASGSPQALACVESGVGDAVSHQTYINQYVAVQDLIRELFEDQRR